MADSFSIDLSQLDALRTRRQGAPDRLTSLISDELAEGAREIASEAAARAPGDVGFLQGRIGSSQEEPLSFNVFSGALYSAYVEFGTRSSVSIPPGLEEYAAQFIG